MRPHPLDRDMPGPERGAELTAAIAAATNGTTISLKRGTYTGAFTISGKNNVTIRPQPGAHVVLTNRDARFLVPNALWTAQPTPGVYRTTETVGQTIHRTNGERVLLTAESDVFDAFVADNLDVVLRGSGENFIYLRGANPNTTPLYIAAADSALLDVTDCDGLRLEKLDFRFGGAQAIDLQSSDGVTIEECTIFGVNVGVRCNGADSPNLTIRRNWIVGAINERWYYRDVKGNSLMEGGATGVPGDSPLIEENVIEDWHNGIGLASASPLMTVDPIIRYNYLRKIQDDAIELDGITVRGEVYENLVLDAFVVFSFAPREVETPGEDTLVHHNAVQATRLNTLFDRTFATTGQPALTKFNGGTAVDLLFENNTMVADGRGIHGAASAVGPYPENVRWNDNIIYSRNGPMVRFTGEAADDCDFEGNVYHIEVPSSAAIIAWNQAEGSPVNYASLAAAKASAPGIASGWEATGIQSNPLFVKTFEPSSLRRGSPAEGKGAWQRTPTRVDSMTLLATGWILIRGSGFESTGEGIGCIDPIVISNTTAFAREFIRPPVSRRPW